MSAASDRNLLVGVLAFQLDFVSRDQLVDAMGHWATTKSSALEDVFLSMELIDAQTHQLLNSLIDKRIGSQLANSVGRLSTDSSEIDTLRSQLSQLDDQDLDRSMRTVLSGEAAKGTKATGEAPDYSNSVNNLATLAESDQSEPSDVRFRILRPHAKGGLGEVAVAMDEELHRHVALKQIQSRFADDQNARQRFILEAEVTGSLEHPGVVPVYALGRHADGRPYYAMRFIRGESLRDAVDRFHRSTGRKSPGSAENFDLRKLLDRFVDVCETIEYAHSRGVLHRDLKPDNIMLAPYGETLVVDWGLAKTGGEHERDAVEPAEPQLQPSSGSGSAPTQMGSVIGTPAYMSPEQASGRVDLIGPTSDVYSLGATLYTILTGRLPFESSEADQRDVGRILHRVAIGDFSPPRKLRSSIPRPLEAICLKAMARERESRYATAQGLADDLERFLADETVSAHADPFTTRARRWMRRHQTLATTGVAIVLLSTVGLLVFSAVLGAKQTELTLSNQELYRAEQVALAAASDAEARRVEAEAAQDSAEKATAIASEARENSSAWSVFLTDHILATARPKGLEGGLGIDVTVIDAIKAAEEKVGTVFAGSPMAEAAARSGIGRSWYTLGEYDSAEAHQLRVIELMEQAGRTGADYLSSLSALATTIKANGRIDKAIEIQERVELAFRQGAGAEDSNALIAANNLALSYAEVGRYAESKAMHQQVLKANRKLFGANSVETINSMDNLAEALRYGDPDSREQALVYLQEVAEKRASLLGESHPNTLKSINNLAMFFSEQGDHETAISMLESTHKRMESTVGSEHPLALAIQMNLGTALLAAGQFESSLAALEKAWMGRQVKLSPDHPETLVAMDNFANALDVAEQIEKSIAMYEKVLAARIRVLGESHIDTLTTLNNLALVYERAGRADDALEMELRNLHLRREAFPNTDDAVLVAIYNLAVTYANASDLERAIPLFAERAELVLQVDGRTAQRTWDAFRDLATAQRSNGMSEESIATSMRILSMMDGQVPNDHASVTTTKVDIALAHLEAEDYLASANQLTALVELLGQQLSRSPTDETRMQQRGMLVYLAVSENELGQYEKAVDHARKSVQIAEDLIPGDWRLFNARSVLGAALSGVGDSTAMTVLLAAHEGLIQCQESLPASLLGEYTNASFDRIIAAYELLGDETAAEEWLTYKQEYAQ